MSRIFAQSVIADVCSRFFNLLLFVLLLPFILVMAVFVPGAKDRPLRFGAADAVAVRAPSRAKGDLKSRS